MDVKEGSRLRHMAEVSSFVPIFPFVLLTELGSSSLVLSSTGRLPRQRSDGQEGTGSERGWRHGYGTGTSFFFSFLTRLERFV
jgi:hypothetical protein